MGLWDSIFGKKVTVQGRTEDGAPFEKSISEKQLKEWEEEGRISKVDAVEVHVLDPGGSYKTNWVVGQDVPAEMVQKFKDPDTGILYAVTVYRSGKPETSVTSHAQWLQVKAAMGE